MVLSFDQTSYAWLAFMIIAFIPFIVVPPICFDKRVWWGFNMSSKVTTVVFFFFAVLRIAGSSLSTQQWDENNNYSEMSFWFFALGQITFALFQESLYRQHLPDWATLWSVLATIFWIVDAIMVGLFAPGTTNGWVSLGLMCVVSLVAMYFMFVSIQAWSYGIEPSEEDTETVCLTEAMGGRRKGKKQLRELDV